LDSQEKTIGTSSGNPKEISLSKVFLKNQKVEKFPEKTAQARNWELPEGDFPHLKKAKDYGKKKKLDSKEGQRPSNR